jgi:hypothetical protein
MEVVLYDLYISCLYVASVITIFNIMVKPALVRCYGRKK